MSVPDLLRWYLWLLPGAIAADALLLTTIAWLLYRRRKRPRA